MSFMAFGLHPAGDVKPDHDRGQRGRRLHRHAVHLLHGRNHRGQDADFWGRQGRLSPHPTDLRIDAFEIRPTRDQAGKG